MPRNEPDFTSKVYGLAFSWESQAEQHPGVASEGMHAHTEHDALGQTEYPIDILTYYGHDNSLEGILYRYPLGWPELEIPMAMNIWVRPDRQGLGIGKALLAESERVWGPIDWTAQRFTPAGEKLVRSYRRRRHDPA